MEFDQNTVLTAVKALSIAAITTDTTTVGDTLDTALFGALTFLIATGVLTDGSYAVQLFHGDASNMSDEVAVPAADLLGSLPSLVLTDDNVVKQFGYKGKKRYVRVKVVSTSTTVGGTLGAFAVKGKPRHAG